MLRKNRNKNHTIDGVDPINLDKELNDFDHVRWAVACRHMQIRLLHGDVEAAKNILGTFYRERCKVRAGINSTVHSVFEQRLADMLTEELNLKTVDDVDGVSDEAYLKIDGLGLPI